MRDPQSLRREISQLPSAGQRTASVVTLSESRRRPVVPASECPAQETDDFLVLKLLIKANESRRILEIGGHKGSFTLQLAKEAAAVGGQITVVGFTQGHRKRIKQRLHAAGLAKRVEFSTGRFSYSLLNMKGPFDLVILDLCGDLYLRCLKLAAPLLAEGALLVSRNLGYLGSKHRGAREYRGELDRLGFQSVRIHIGEGFGVSIKP